MTGESGHLQASQESVEVGHEDTRVRCRYWFCARRPRRHSVSGTATRPGGPGPIPFRTGQGIIAHVPSAVACETSTPEGRDREGEKTSCT